MTINATIIDKYSAEDNPSVKYIAADNEQTTAECELGIPPFAKPSLKLLFCPLRILITHFKKTEDNHATTTVIKK
jgi:hypothetical protein